MEDANERLDHAVKTVSALELELLRARAEFLAASLLDAQDEAAAQED